MTDEEEYESEEWDSTVKGKRRLFVLNYCTVEDCLFNAAESYRQAYTTKNKEPAKATCESNGSRLLQNANVRLAIQRLLKHTQATIDDEMVYKVLHDIVQGATFNPAEVLQANGSLKTKTLAALGDKAKLISQIEKTKFGVKYTLVDRKQYLDMLIKYLKLVRPEQIVDVKLPVIEVTPKYTDDENKTAVEKWNEIAAKE